MLVTDEQRARLIAHGAQSLLDPDFDPRSVLKLFAPAGAATWLLTELDPQDEDTAYGLCDLGFGEPECGTVSLRELAALRDPLGLGVEQDTSFVADRPLSAYANAAISAGRIET